MAAKKTSAKKRTSNERHAKAPAAKPAAKRKQVAKAAVSKAAKRDPADGELLRAILDAPESEDARLVYADWLMDRGDPRGEFILIQCTLGRPLLGASGYVLRNHPDEKTPLSREELEAREKKLLKQHQKQWVEPFRAPIRTWSWQWGFVSAVVADATKFLKGYRVLFDHTPLVELELTAVKPQLLDQLAKLPELSRITRLKLPQQRIDQNSAHFFHSKQLANVQELDIWGNPLGEQGAKILGQAPHLDSLQKLDLTSTKLNPAGLDAISRSKFFPQLTQLELDYNDDLDSSIGAMLARGKSLRQLELNSCRLGEDGLKALASGVPKLEQLGLFGCNIGAGGAAFLCDSPHFKNLRVIQGLVGYHHSDIKEKSPAAKKLHARFGDGVT